MSERLRDVDSEEDWERVVAAAAQLQSIVPDAVLVGGCAAALYARHRFSRDDDHVVVNLTQTFAHVLDDLEQVSGWKTARLRPPVLILGQLNGVDTGVRNLRRARPLETVTADTRYGLITLPTVQEMLRIKSYLIAVRNATRDYLDVAALSGKIDAEKAGIAASVIAQMDAYYPQDNGASFALQVARQLADPTPFDLDRSKSLQIYRITDPAFSSWDAVRLKLTALGVDTLRTWAELNRGEAACD